MRYFPNGVRSRLPVLLLRLPSRLTLTATGTNDEPVFSAPTRPRRPRRHHELGGPPREEQHHLPVHNRDSIRSGVCGSSSGYRPHGSRSPIALRLTHGAPEDATPARDPRAPAAVAGCQMDAMYRWVKGHADDVEKAGCDELVKRARESFIASHRGRPRRMGACRVYLSEFSATYGDLSLTRQSSRRLWGSRPRVAVRPRS